MAKIDKNWLASIGITEADLQQAATQQTEPIEKDRAEWEAQSLLRSLTWPYPEMVPKNCKKCDRIFMTNYRAVGYCSTRCFKAALLERGYRWDPDETYEKMWGYMEPPLTIPPEALTAMRHLIHLVDQETMNQSHSQEQDSVPVLSIEEPESLPDPPNPSSDPDIQSESPAEDVEFLAILDALGE